MLPCGLFTPNWDVWGSSHYFGVCPGQRGQDLLVQEGRQLVSVVELTGNL